MSELSLDEQLLEAARCGDTASCMRLLDQGADLRSQKNKDGWTALHCAAWQGHTETCLALLDCGSEIEAMDRFGSTALMSAAEHGCTETCLALLDRGADLETRGRAGLTALHVAAIDDRTETCLALLERGAQIDVVDDSGETALCRACFYEHSETCLALVAYGSDPANGSEDMEGLTQIEAAARGGFLPRLMTLLENSEVNHQALVDVALEHGQEEAAVAIRSHAARAQIKNIAKGAAPCLS